MSDIAAEVFDGGHGFRTTLMAGFEREFSKVKKHVCIFGCVGFFKGASRCILTQMIMAKKESGEQGG